MTNSTQLISTDHKNIGALLKEWFPNPANDFIILKRLEEIQKSNVDM